MPLLILFPRAVATKWAHQAMLATECLWHLLEPPKLATESPPTTLKIREVVVVTVAVTEGTTVPMLDALTTTACASELATAVGLGLEVAAAAEAGAAIGKMIAAALRPGTNEAVRDHPPDAVPRGIVTPMPVGKTQCDVL